MGIEHLGKEENDLEAIESFERFSIRYNDLFNDLDESYLGLLEDDDEKSEDIFNKLYEVLCIDMTQTFNIVFSTGGPQESLEVECYLHYNEMGALDEWSIKSLTFIYLPWYDRKEIPIEEGDAFYDIWKRYAELQIEPIMEAKLYVLS